MGAVTPFTAARLSADVQDEVRNLYSKEDVVAAEAPKYALCFSARTFTGVHDRHFLRESDTLYRL